MIVALLEICEKNHYMVTHALIKTYASDKHNKVLVFTTKSIFQNLVEDNKIENVEFIIKDEDSTVSGFLQKVNSMEFNRIHYCTISKYYAEFNKFLPDKDIEIFFHFHNIDIWFRTIFIDHLKNIFTKIKKRYNILAIYNQIKWAVKELLRDPERKKLIANLIALDPHYVALSNVQKKILKKYISEEKIIIFPSLIFENKPAINKISGKLNLCIPGGVSDTRRDYSGFLDSVLSNIEFYKKNVTIELLGYLNPSENHLIKKITHIKNTGISILYYDHFLTPTAYDTRLAACDIVLGNITLVLSTDGNGQLKETGAVYNLIRGAKPGLFPAGYILDDEFHESTVHYNNYDHLAAILGDLYKDSARIITLKEKAMILSEKFTAEMLLKRLTL